jgi:molybdopterin-guanine dinucleotide biosynthesis protein A
MSEQPGGAGRINAVVLAGGRIDGPWAETAGTSVKALVPVHGMTVLARVVSALAETPEIGRISVIGPDETRSVVEEQTLWALETGTALGNVRAGLGVLDARGETPVLVCASDTPLLTPQSIADFLHRAPDTAEICLPIVEQAAFERVYPESRNTYLPLREGQFTGGSCLLMRPRAVLENLPLLEKMFGRRKSQIGMASVLGPRIIWKLLTKTLTIPDIESRASALTHCVCRAAPDCRPELAFDMDDADDWAYVKGRLG